MTSATTSLPVIAFKFQETHTIECLQVTTRYSNITFVQSVELSNIPKTKKKDSFVRKTIQKLNKALLDQIAKDFNEAPQIDRFDVQITYSEDDQSKTRKYWVFLNNQKTTSLLTIREQQGSEETKSSPLLIIRERQDSRETTSSPLLIISGQQDSETTSLPLETIWKRQNLARTSFVVEAK